MVAIGLLLIVLDNTILFTVLPTLTDALDASYAQGLWVINIYSLVLTGLLPGTGTLGDRIGHRRMYLSGLVVFGLASLAAAFSPSVTALIAARAALAVGAAMMMPATLALIRVVFEDERERSLAISVWASFSLLGAVAGPILGGLLLQHFWWGSVFLINVPMVILAFCGILLLGPATQPQPSGRWDWLSSLLAMLALCALVAGIKELAHPDLHWPRAALALAVCVVTGWLFSRRQSRLSYPLLDFSLFRNIAFLSGVLAAVLVTFALGGLQVAITQRFQWVAGFSPLEAGALVTAVAVGALPTTLLGGLLLHRIGLRSLIAGGLAVGAVGLWLAARLDAGLTPVVSGLILVGAGLGATISVASNAIVSNAPAHRAGMASSVEEVAYEFGALIGVAFIGSLLAALYAQGLQLPPGAPEAARGYIAEALALADAHAGLQAAATQAFDAGYTRVMQVTAVCLALGAAFTAWLLRRHGPGSALSPTGPS